MNDFQIDMAFKNNISCGVLQGYLYPPHLGK
jgi:hypothetical protein